MDQIVKIELWHYQKGTVPYIIDLSIDEVKTQNGGPILHDVAFLLHTAKQIVEQTKYNPDYTPEVLTDKYQERKKLEKDICNRYTNLMNHPAARIGKIYDQVGDPFGYSGANVYKILAKNGAIQNPRKR